MARVIQINLNHARQAQDLLMQHVAEWGAEIAIIAEPHRVPNSPGWVVDQTGRAAIHATTARTGGNLRLAERGHGYVVARWRDVDIVSCYISPSVAMDQYEETLTHLRDAIRRCRGGRVLVGGDFNAWSPLWGSRATNSRGEVLVDWATELGLVVRNVGTEPTCVKHNGTSIVDVTWTSPAMARRVREWRVLTATETLSDHAYVSMRIDDRHAGTGGARSTGNNRCRWSLRRMDPEALTEALRTAMWARGSRGEEDAETAARRMSRMLKAASDASMPRVRKTDGGKKSSAYWWTEEIARARRTANAARRTFLRARRRQRGQPDTAETVALRGTYAEAKSALRTEIKKAKKAAWDELLRTVEGDPWGRPYRTVMGRLRPYTRPATESMTRRELTATLNELFPAAEPTANAEDEGRAAEREASDWTPENEVTVREMSDAIARMKRKRTAPGPDGIHGGMLAAAMPILEPAIRDLMNKCLREGVFPGKWKEAHLVLIPKPGGRGKYRPICLLGETGKMLETIIANRISIHLERAGPNLSANQFGYRKGHSTIDALRKVRKIATAATSEGGRALAISIDVANAFNALPWNAIHRALRHHNVPVYLRKIVAAYLRDRSVLYSARGGERRREVKRGVPQGSVLGPLLWDIAYDRVVRGARPNGCTLVCYADDTVIVATGGDWRGARHAAENGAAAAITDIRDLGLEVNADKTEATWLGLGARERPPRGEGTTLVGGKRVAIAPRLRYLGVELDSKWRYLDHVRLLAPRLDGAAAALGRLMPNLRGPDDGPRRLYAGVINSMALYGAPEWAAPVAASRRAREILGSVKRRMDLRRTRAYRTVSAAAASVLAGTPPLDLVALQRKRAFDLRARDRRRGRTRTEAEERRRSERLERRTMREWRSRLEEDTAASENRTVRAILPVLERWARREHGRLSYRTTQMLTGHGCFGQYLHRIGREPTPRCHHCSESTDSTEHTVQRCPAWREERRRLVEAIGEEPELPAVARLILEDPTKWEAFSTFAEEVLTRKEAAEREREEAARDNPELRAGPRHRRGGGQQQRPNRATTAAG